MGDWRGRINAEAAQAECRGPPTFVTRASDG
jgi:hypothetical protein